MIVGRTGRVGLILGGCDPWMAATFSQTRSSLELFCRSYATREIATLVDGHFDGAYNRSIKSTQTTTFEQRPRQIFCV